MVVYTNFFMLSRKYIVLNNWNSIKFNSILYNNEVSILGYNAVYISRFRFKHMLRKKLFFSSEHFFKPNDFNINFNLCNKLNVNYLDSIYNNNFLFKSVFENKGHLLNSSLGTDYGLSTLISISSYKKLYNPKFSIMSSYCWYQFKYDNYRRCTAMDFDLITDLALEDLIYFYKDLYDTESTFKLWKWYAYWNGIDFHVHWGWLGYYKLLKIKSLKRRVFLATWWWSLLQDLYLKLEQVIDLHTELGWLLDFWWINIDPNFRAPVWLWKYNLLLY